MSEGRGTREEGGARREGEGIVGGGGRGGGGVDYIGSGALLDLDHEYLRDVLA